MFHDFLTADFGSHLQKNIASNMSMMFHYWLAYATTTMKPTSYRSGYAMPYFQQWLTQSNIECDRYLRSESFLNSLNEYMGSVARLYSIAKVMSYPITSSLSLIDTYISSVQGNMLEMQETPHHVAHSIEDVRLLRYSGSQPARKNGTPLLIVYAPVNRYHIMDIRKGRSIVEHFLSAGFDVYLLDWGKQLNNKPSLSDYVGYIHRSIEYIKKISGVDQVSILGYSWGGVLSMIYSSLRVANVKNLILQSAHVDFHRDTSTLAYWFRKLPIDDITKEFDVIDCRFINLALLMRNPAVHFLDAFRFASDMNKDMPSIEFWPDAIRIIGWLSDTPLIPAGFFRDFIGKLYQQNQLVKKELEVTLSSDSSRPETVDLAEITMSLLNIVGDQDDICTPPSSIPINDIATSKDKELVRFPTGHIELSVSSTVHNELWPRVVKWLKQRS